MVLLPVKTDVTKQTLEGDPEVTVPQCSNILRTTQYFSTEYKKGYFPKGKYVFSVVKEERDARLIIFSMNYFVLLGKVSLYSQNVFSSFFEHVGSCKSFTFSWIH